MPEAYSTVEYRAIQGFPGYRVGNDGSVWTRWKQIGLGWRYGFKLILEETWRQLKQRPNPNGRLVVCLCREQKAYWRQSHRLILEAFIGPRPPKMECCHEDGNPLNNHISNLRWDTHKSNMKDKIKHGTQPRGENHPDAKLTENQVRAIRSDYAKMRGNRGRVPSGLLAMLAEKYNVHTGTIGSIVRRRTWKHVTDHAV